MKEGIIARGPISDSAWEDFRRKREEIRLRVTMKYASIYGKASWWGKLILDAKIAYEIRSDVAKLDPRYRL